MWEDVHVNFNLRVKQQSYTFGIAFAFIILSVVVCKNLQIAMGPGVAAIWISATNIIIPIYLRHLCFKVRRTAAAVAGHLLSVKTWKYNQRQHHLRRPYFGR